MGSSSHFQGMSGGDSFRPSFLGLRCALPLLGRFFLRKTMEDLEFCWRLETVTGFGKPSSNSCSESMSCMEKRKLCKSTQHLNLDGHLKSPPPANSSHGKGWRKNSLENHPSEFRAWLILSTGIMSSVWDGKVHWDHVVTPAKRKPESQSDS